MIEKIIDLIVANNNVKEVSLTVVKLWASVLGKYDFELVQQAAMEYITSDESKYDRGMMPSLGTIVSRLEKIMFGNDAERELWANNAWSEIYYAISHGQSQPSDPIALRALKAMGGWDSLRMMLQSEEPFKRKKFVELYLTCIEQEKSSTFANEELSYESKAALEQM